MAILSQQPATERTPTLAQWESLKYGMFIHYGMSTFTQNEFGQVPAMSFQYRPTNLNVEQWVKVAKDAGMKYAILTAKHCYGHALWPTKFSEYSVSTSGDKTDVCRAFVDACRKHGVKPGFYYLLGWDSQHQPRMTPAEYEAFVTNQLTELLKAYGPLLQLWLDIPWDMGPDTGGALARIYAAIKKVQPDCLVLLNNGFVDGSKVLSAKPTYFFKPAGEKTVPCWPADLIDGERTLPPAGGHDPWISFDGKKHYIPMETCDTLNEHWFWVKDDGPRSLRSLYRLYSDTTQRGANLLLDVAPDQTGTIPQESIQRLKELRDVIEGRKTLPRDVAQGAKATASNVYQNDARYSADKAFDGDSSTRWATDTALKTATLEADLGAPKSFRAIYLREAYARIRRFEVEAERAGKWVVIARGETIGWSGVTLKCRKTTSSKVRLNVLDAIDGPTIWDFELLE